MEIRKEVKYQHRVKEVLVRADRLEKDAKIAYIDVEKESVLFTNAEVSIHILRNIVSHWSDLIRDNKANSNIINK